MIKALVSIEADLASSVAIRFACQLGGLMDVEILPVYVKESPPHDTVMGAGWVSRTWEQEMVHQGTEEIAELIATEKDFCPVLRDPRVVYGDREAELLKIAQGEQFDLFVEGAHFPWTPGDLYKKIHTKFYQRIPWPVALVRSLRKMNRVQLLCLDANGTRALTGAFKSIWKDCPAPLLLNHPDDHINQARSTELREAVEESSAILKGAGCSVTVHGNLPSNPEAKAANILADASLVAIAVERSIKKDGPELQWLAEVKTSSLIVFH